MMKKQGGKSLCLFSGAGGVGKTFLTLCLAGIYESIEKKVLIMDMDLSGGCISLSLNKAFDKTIYNFVDDFNNNRFKNFKDYVTHYDDYIDVLPSPKDPRQAIKIDSKYIEIALEKAIHYYDIVLIDTNHNLNELNLVLLDAVDEILFVLQNDPMDLKNMKSILAIFRDLEKTNFKLLLNHSRDPYKKYFTLFDIKSVLKNNIDYVLSNEFYIKNIDSYIMNGKIITLEPKAPNIFNKDYTTLMKVAVDMLERSDDHGTK